MSSYFNPTPLQVVDGDTAKSADLNIYGTSLDASFDLVESAIATANADAELWAGVSQEWAEKAEDVEVEIGKYSALHWAAKSGDHSDTSSTYATNSLNSANASEVSNVASGVAQVAAELAETNAENAQGLSEDARDASAIAQGLSEDAEDASVIAQVASELAETNSQLSYWESEASRQTSDNYAVTVEDTLVDIVTSDGDGTYTNTPSVNYSSLHWASKAAASTLPSGTKMVFYQASAPIGWTQDSTHNDKMLRVVSGSGGGNGGSDSPILMDKVPTHNHTASSDTTGAHTHTYDKARMGEYTGSGTLSSSFRYTDVDSTGSNGDHSHTITVYNNSGSNWTPLYIDLIICTKD